jgi:hypothetical protein
VAKLVVDVVTGDTVLPKRKRDGKNPAAVALRILSGLKGSKARADSLTSEQRKK